jgi:uncharacterized protein (TIRG00374 family)
VKSKSKLLATKWLHISLGIIISFGALYLALRGVDLRSVWLSIQNAIWEYVFLALGCVAINTLAKTLRWRLLIGTPGQNITNITYLKVLLAGQMLNTIFPARLGELGRAYVLGGMGPGRSYVLGTIVLEKALDSIAYIILFVALILLIPIPDWIGSSFFVFLLVTLTIVGGILLLVFWPNPFIRLLNAFLNRMPERLRLWLSPRIESGLTSLEIVRRRDDLLRLVLWTGLIWCLAILTNYFTLLALDIHLPIPASMLILFVLQAGISIPSIPGTIGLFEYICVLTLSVYGINQSLALSFGLLLHAIVLIPSTLAGMVSFWSLGLSGQQGRFQDTIGK